ncbi:MAG: hypothetical protein AAFU56_05055 [Pseudomonadota bacterium]
MQDTVVIDESVLETVRAHIRRGDKVLLRRSAWDEGRIKIKHGSFGSLTKRLTVDIATYEAVKKILGLL